MIKLDKIGIMGLFNWGQAYYLDMEQSYQERELWMAYLQTDPRLDSLRGDPRFNELVRRVGLSQ